jgi:hypothetical protein
MARKQSPPKTIRGFDGMDKVEQVDSRLSTHEEVCALRYEAINARLKRLEGILMASAGAIILLLLSIVLK